MSKLLVVSPDTVPINQELAAGPGIRYWEIAKALMRRGHEVTLAVPEQNLSQRTTREGLEIVAWRPGLLKELTYDKQCVLLPYVDSNLATAYLEETRDDIPTVVDLYDPVLVENPNLETKDSQGLRNYLSYLRRISPLMARGDLFLCANERQRLYYLGVLSVWGRLNPLTYGEDLLRLVPFGVSGEEPKSVKRVLKGKIVDENSLVILWFSGIYPWFDAVTLVKAMPKILKRIPQAKLVVLGAIHPRLHAPPDEYRKTVEEAKKLDLLGKHIFFCEWRPYAERASWYAEADLAICTYKYGLETLLSHRTRVVDLLWGGLPVVTSEGDEMAEFLETEKCGTTVRIGDDIQLAQVVTSLLGKPQKLKEMAANARQVAREKLSWDKVIEPLNSFCENPKLARDRMKTRDRRMISAKDSLSEFSMFLEKVESFKGIYNEEGFAGALKRIFLFIRQKLVSPEG